MEMETLEESSEFRHFVLAKDLVKHIKQDGSIISTCSKKIAASSPSKDKMEHPPPVQKEYKHYKSGNARKDDG